MGISLDFVFVLDFDDANSPRISSRCFCTFVGNNSQTSSTIRVIKLLSKYTTRNSNYILAVVKRSFDLGGVIPLVCLDRGKFATFNIYLTQTLVTCTVYNRNCCTILDSTIIFRLIYCITGYSNCAVLNIQIAGTNLHTHSLSSNGGIFDSCSTRTREIDTETIRHIQRRIFQSNNIICIHAIALNAACAVSCHSYAIKYQCSIIIGNRTIHCRRNSCNTISTYDCTILYCQRNIRVVNIKGFLTASIGVGMTIQIKRTINRA